MIDLAPEHLHEVKRILNFYAPGYPVIVFGSRVRGRAKAHSDLDLALVSDAHIPDKTLSKLKAGFSISDIPIMVDVLDLSRVSENFKEIILDTGEPLDLEEKTTPHA